MEDFHRKPINCCNVAWHLGAGINPRLRAKVTLVASNYRAPRCHYTDRRINPLATSLQDANLARPKGAMLIPLVLLKEL